MNKTLLIIALLFCGITMSYAQSDDVLTRMGNDKKFKADYEKAEVLLLDNNFEEALKTYMKWDSVYPNNANLNFKIGYCYANMSSEKPRAIPYLEKAASNIVKEYTGEYNETNAPVDVFMYLGIVIMLITNSTKLLKITTSSSNTQNMMSRNWLTRLEF
jgi:outer membrane protein assembly factor BamD (BamD/ComL family)